MVTAAIVLQKESADTRPAPFLSRAELLARYRHLREVSRQHHSAALNFLSKDAIISQARRIGLTQGKRLDVFGIRPCYPHRTEGSLSGD